MTDRSTGSAMILAAGLGTRLQQLTANRPKALVELNGKTLLQRTIENLIRNGFHHIVINVHHFGDQIIDFVESHPCKDAIIEISDERSQLMDTGGGILQALPFFDPSETVLIHNVDIITDLDLQAIRNAFQRSEDAAWLLCQQRDSSRKLLFSSEDQLVGWKNNLKEEYKWVNCPLNNYKELAFSGLHFFRPQLFKGLEVKPCSIIDLYLYLAKTHSIRSELIAPDYWFDLGKIEQLEHASLLLKNLNHD